MNNHVKEEHLEAYVMGTIPEEQAVSIEEHLLFCATCQDQLESAERYLRAMRGAAQRLRNETAAAPATSGLMDWLRSWLHNPVPVWAGALTAVALVAILLSLRVGTRPGALVDVELHAIRGSAAETAPPGHALRLLLDSRGVPETRVWRIQIVDEDGSPVWAGAGTSSGNTITASADRSFKTGTYFVRLLKEGDDPIREYQLVVR